MTHTLDFIELGLEIVLFAGIMAVAGYYLHRLWKNLHKLHVEDTNESLIAVMEYIQHLNEDLVRLSKKMDVIIEEQREQTRIILHTGYTEPTPLDK